jgi:membrane associated rhomboid family serine protease
MTHTVPIAVEIFRVLTYLILLPFGIMIRMRFLTGRAYRMVEGKRGEKIINASAIVAILALVVGETAALRGGPSARDLVQLGIAGWYAHVLVANFVRAHEERRQRREREMIATASDRYAIPEASQAELFENERLEARKQVDQVG